MSDTTQVQAAVNLMKGSVTSPPRENSWFETMASAWGSALNDQARRIESLSAGVADGFESPAQITELTAESLRMGYLSNSSHTAITAAGSALETLARKQ